MRNIRIISPLGTALELHKNNIDSEPLPVLCAPSEAGKWDGLTWPGSAPTPDGKEGALVSPLEIICLCSVAPSIGTLGHKGFVRRGRGGESEGSSCGPAEDLPQAVRALTSVLPQP